MTKTEAIAYLRRKSLQEKLSDEIPIITQLSEETFRDLEHTKSVNPKNTNANQTPKGQSKEMRS